MVNTAKDINVEAELEAEAEAEKGTVAESGSGLDSNVAGALSYLFGFVSGLIFYLIEKEDSFVRWHAAQSIALSAVLTVAYIVLTFLGTAVSVLTFSGSTGGFLAGSLISLILGLVWLIVAVGGFVVWAYMMIKTYQGETIRLPIAASIADRFA